LEQHISADIAYAVWRYWDVTRDASFLRDAGAEIILETARFWASRVRLGSDGLFHIDGVIGPDEYHEAVDDNAFTNVMAQWNLERGAEIASMLQRRWPDRWAELVAKLHIEPGEVATWSATAAKMFTGFDPETGLFEQFAGYYKLEPIDLTAYEPRTVPIGLLLGRERVQRSQAIKQADVVMLLDLLEARFPESVRRANFDYYEPRSDHGSSLSPAIHALVAARLGEVSLAKRYVDQTAAIDLDNSMGNAAHGVHIAAMGGLWQSVVFGFAGLRRSPGELAFDPHLPRDWTAIRFPVRWRGRLVRIAVEQRPPMFCATLERGKPMKIEVGGASCELRSGLTWCCSLEASRDLEGDCHE
jgi:kojibiose phosphorylase